VVVSKRNLADMPGLDKALQESLRTYREGDEVSASAILPDIGVTLPVPAWGEAAFYNVGSANFGIGSSSTLTLMVIPSDERAWLDGIICTRASGDNNMRALEVTQPLGYRSGTGKVDIMFLLVGDANIYWPDPSAEQGVFRAIKVGPLLLEPGATVGLVANGDGVAATVFDTVILRRRMRMIRATPPDVV